MCALGELLGIRALDLTLEYAETAIGCMHANMACRNLPVSDQVGRGAVFSWPSAACAGGASATAVVAAVAKAAKAGALKTKDMEPKRGRSSYLGFEKVKGIPDPGASAVAEWLGHLPSEF
jgi:hypothetical protein